MERVSINTLVDCGTASGDDPVLPFAQFPVPPDKIDYLLLTHAHIDHIGRVPELIEAGFRGEIICPHATKAMLLPMLRDANARDFRVIFSGDLGYTGTPILSDPDPPESCGLLILESIHGDRLQCEGNVE